MQPQFTSAPRRVPPSLQIVNFFNGFAQLGWLLFGFGMIFVWAFVGNADFSFINFRGPYGVTEGKVMNVEPTSASVNKRKVYANHYEYSVDGKLLEGTSYSTGESVEAGQKVEVEFSTDDPTRSRISGMRRALFGPGVGFVAIFPLIGLAFLIPATLSGIKRNRLLRNGLLAQGTLTSKEPTNMTVNHRRVYELKFDFTARDGRHYEAKARTSDTRKLEDETQEPLLYDPNDPTRACLLDDAPARPEIELNGDLRGNPARAVRSLILPVLFISVHGLILLIKMDVLNF